MDNLGNDLKLRRALNEDCKDLWVWRNNREVRKICSKLEPVPWSEHKEWFYLKMNDAQTKIFIAYQKDKKLGVIRFEIIGKFVRVSVNLNPDFFGRGLGSRLIKLGTEKFVTETKSNKPIIAEIKRDNIVSRKAFQKAGFILGNTANKADKLIKIIK